VFTICAMSDPRERILSCACELYLKAGFDGFSMRGLARRVGVTAPALYRHYESREKVLLDVVGEAHNLEAQYLYRSLSEPTPRERFAAAGQAWLDFALEHPRYFQMIHAFPEIMGLDEIPEEVERGVCASQQFWDDRVRECMDAGILRPDDTEQIGLALWAHGYGLISLYLRGLLEVPEEVFRDLYRASFARIFRGMGSDEFARILTAEMAEAKGAEPSASTAGGEGK